MRRSDGRVREEQDTRRLCTQRAAKEWLERGRGTGSDGTAPFQELDVPRYFHSPLFSSSSGAPRGRSGWSGGRAGSKGAVPPPFGAPEGGCGGWAGCACVCVEQTWTVVVDMEEDEAESEADAEDGAFGHIVGLCVDQTWAVAVD